MRSRWLPDLLNIAVAQTEHDRRVGSCHLWVMHTFAPLVHTFAECQTAAERLHETCQHQDDTEGPINVLNRYSSVNHLQAVYTIYINIL
jgi:hypothetical protein